MLMIGLYDNETEKEQEAVWLSAEIVGWYWFAFLKDMHNWTPINELGGDKNDTTCNSLGKKKGKKIKKT